MRQQILLDTGPLVALIDRCDHYHSWVTTELATIQPPLPSDRAPHRNYPQCNRVVRGLGS